MDLEQFFSAEEPQQAWGSFQEVERWRRIRVSVAAYAYEFHAQSFMSDAEYDQMCALVDTSIITNNAKLDKFFGEHFNPSTGQWIHKHPELDGIKQLYEKYYEERCQ